MGVIFGYYAALDDQDAGRVILYAEGQAGGSGDDQVLVSGIDPVVDLPWVEFALTGRSSRFIKSDPGHARMVSSAGDGESVISITDSLREALASADPDFLDDIAKNWRVSDSSAPSFDASSLSDFLRKLAVLAERAIADGAHMYCWKRLKLII
ncbi:hypothetical protein ACFVJM_35350 [Streptomyces virginiae]|uniref:hypothetical protein n=1 Tax=Streptomyces virginiae TaxID=1961 RepID=UPI00363892A3